MEARMFRAAFLAAAVLSLGAGYRTKNFIVTASSPELATEIGAAAEKFRHDLAIEWLGQDLPDWQDPCSITANVSTQLGAGGATTFMFNQGRPFGWTMSVQGSRERVLDSVLPHEITHTIFATHFGQPLPRWADEGGCTTVEHESERYKQQQLLIQFLTTNRGIPFNQMFAMKEYPPDIMPLYSQGYSLARYLISQGGKRKYVDYIGDGLRWKNWTSATQKHYGFRNLSELQVRWLDWVRQGSPDLIAQNQPSAAAPQVEQVAAATPSTEPLVPVSNVAVEPSPFDRARTAASRAADGAATKATPVHEAVAAGEGWYVRQAGLARAKRDRDTPGAPSAGVPLAAENRSVAASPASSVASAPAATRQSLSRPQPIGRPQQTVIDWGQPAPANTHIPVSQRPPIHAPQIPIPDLGAPDPARARSLFIR